MLNLFIIQDLFLNIKQTEIPTLVSKLMLMRK
jgi:hypothetical protein